MKKKWYRIGTLAVVFSLFLCFGAFAGEWVKDSTGWWFRNSDGSYPASGIYEIGGKVYAFNESGYMAENDWFRHPKTGDWYYATGSGELAHSQWIGDYYVGNDGSMMTDAWIDGYYVGDDGKWVEGATMPETSYDNLDSTYDEYGDTRSPFADAPLGYNSNSGSYSSYSGGKSDLETYSIPHYDW